MQIQTKIFINIKRVRSFVFVSHMPVVSKFISSLCCYKKGPGFVRYYRDIIVRLHNIYPCDIMAEN